MRCALMKNVLVLLAAMSLAGAALAQQYKWVDQDGKVRYGDSPPPGVKATPLRPPPPPASPPPSSGKAGAVAKDAKAAPKGPLTPAEQEADYRRRQIEAQKAQEKDQKAAQEAQAKRDNCARAQEQLRLIESGQRIARTDAKGERYFLDDAQIAQEAVKGRQSVSQWCN